MENNFYDYILDGDVRKVTDVLRSSNNIIPDDWKDILVREIYSDSENQNLQKIYELFILNGMHIDVNDAIIFFDNMSMLKLLYYYGSMKMLNNAVIHGNLEDNIYIQDLIGEFTEKRDNFDIQFSNNDIIMKNYNYLTKKEQDKIEDILDNNSWNRAETLIKNMIKRNHTF